jgi:hypothetical protein
MLSQGESEIIKALTSISEGIMVMTREINALSDIMIKMQVELSEIRREMESE